MTQGPHCAKIRISYFVSKMMRHFSFADELIAQLDTAIKTLNPPKPRLAMRKTPGQNLKEARLTIQEKKHIAGLVRVNHAGEVCAQALYQGQALTAKLPHIQEQMNHAALEEVDHLAWCEERLQDLNSRPSFLNPIWYLGSLFIGAIAGLAGDGYSLGFVAETEKQVTAHLAHHLNKLPIDDLKTREILSTMQEDEMAHAQTAIDSGAFSLPRPIQVLMSGVSKLMTSSSYYI